MKIVISHVYSNDNKGDAALLSVLLSDISRAFGKTDVTILTFDNITMGEKFEGADVVNSFMYYAGEHNQNAIIRVIKALFIAVSTLAWAFTRRYSGLSIPLPRKLRDVAVLYQEADLVIPVGGGYIRAKSGFVDTATLFFIIHPFLFARTLGKTTIAYTQSVGPFGNKFQEFLVKFGIKTLDGIIVREDISLQLLKKWGVTENVSVSVDSGFSFVSKEKKDIRGELNIPAGQLLVGITVRNWLGTREQIEYEKAIAKLADYMVQKYKAFVLFIPQVTVESHADDDRESSRRVFGHMEHKGSAQVIQERYSHKAIKAIYGSLDYLVGTRFHSVIFALTSYVPSIAIGYEHKTRGIMRDLGLENWVVDIGDVQADKLKDLFDKLVKDRTGYVERLRAVLPAYIKQADESIYFVRKLYENKKRTI